MSPFAFTDTRDADTNEAVAAAIANGLFDLTASTEGDLSSASSALAVHEGLMRVGNIVGNIDNVTTARTMLDSALHRLREIELWASVGLPVPANA